MAAEPDDTDPAPKQIVVRDLTRRYEEVEAVRGISFSVREGESFAFLGPNGAGKTTTISMLCTLLDPTSGSARVGGHDVVTERPAVRRSIGVVFQQPTLDEQLTAEQNLRFHAMAYGMPKKMAARRMDELLEMVGLADRRKDAVRGFSGGMKRRLEIVRGILHRPRVLFLDEPTLGLDPQTRMHVWRHLRELREREKITVFFSTHYMDEAENSDRIAVIDHGRIVALDTPDALKDQVGGDLVSLTTEDDQAALQTLRERFDVDPELDDEEGLTFRVSRGAEFLPGLLRDFPHRVESINVRRPTLDDVFVSLTGHRIRDDGDSPDQARAMGRGGRRS
jgi:ABC-2 type transport system ATP-binding protein